MSEKKIFTAGLADVIINTLKTSPESQLSSELRTQVIDYFKPQRSLGETYDYISSISTKPITEASFFVKTLCNVSNFYKRPEE